MQYGINSDAEKTSALWSDQTNKYEYFAGEKMLLSDQRRITKQATFTYFPKQIKAIEDQGENNLKL